MAHEGVTNKRMPIESSSYAGFIHSLNEFLKRLFDHYHHHHHHHHHQLHLRLRRLVVNELAIFSCRDRVAAIVASYLAADGY